MPAGPITRVEVAAVVATLLLVGALLLGVARRTSATFDEPSFVAAGWSALRGDYRLSNIHPPLARMLHAAPLALMGAVAPPQVDGALDVSVEERDGRDHRTGAWFLFRNQLPAQVLLVRARLASVAITLLMCATVWAAARARYGPRAGALALLLIGLEPLVLAHGPLALTDIPLTAFGFAALESLREFHRGGGARWLVAAGLLLGAAAASKASALILLPAIGVQALLPWRDAGARPLPRRLGATVVVTVVAALVVLALYRFDPHLAAVPFLRAVTYAGAPSDVYLMGAFHPRKPWTYYFVAVGIKSSIALLALTGARLLLDLVGALRRRTSVDDVRDLVLPALMLGVTAGAGLAIGVRHVLPIYPFLVVYAAGIATRGRTILRPRPGGGATALLRLAPIALVACQAAEAALAFPHYIPWFNRLSGGSARGVYWLTDSNVDWGQAMLSLGEWLKSHPRVRGVYLAPFWVGDPAAHGISHQLLFGSGVVPEGEHQFQPGEPRVVAISANVLVGVGDAERRDLYAWLRPRRPLAVIGNAMFLYDVTGDGAAQVALARAFRLHGRPDRAEAALREAARLGVTTEAGAR
jgi:hypothetical protein